MLPKQDINWWFWLSTIPFLTIGLLGEQTGFTIAVTITIMQVIYFYWREKSIMAFIVQVRIAYLTCIVVGLLPYMEWIIWMQLVGTSITVLAEYCLLARLISLAPWNRHQELNKRLVLKTIFSRPVRGAVLQAGDQIHQSL